MSEEKMRSEFEEWASTHFFLQEEDEIIDDSDEYISGDMQLAWEAWYASRAAPDVTQLVEALEQAGLALHEMDEGHAALVDIDNALAAYYRKEGEA